MAPQDDLRAIECLRKLLAYGSFRPFIAGQSVKRLGKRKPGFFRADLRRQALGYWSKIIQGVCKKGYKGWVKIAWTDAGVY